MATAAKFVLPVAASPSASVVEGPRQAAEPAECRMVRA